MKHDNNPAYHHYWWLSPRGFANEGWILKAPPRHEKVEALRKRAQQIPGFIFTRITRIEALETASMWRKEHRKMLQGYSAETVCGPCDITDVEDLDLSLVKRLSLE